MQTPPNFHFGIKKCTKKVYCYIKQIISATCFFFSCLTSIICRWFVNGSIGFCFKKTFFPVICSSCSWTKTLRKISWIKNKTLLIHFFKFVSRKFVFSLVTIFDYILAKNNLSSCQYRHYAIARNLRRLCQCPSLSWSKSFLKLLFHHHPRMFFLWPTLTFTTIISFDPQKF